MRLKPIRIFSGINQKEYEEILRLGCARKQSFPKDSVIYHLGDKIKEVAVVLSGRIHIRNIDFWGNVMIINHIDSGQIFGTSYAFGGVPMSVEAIAAEECVVMFINIPLVLSSGESKSWYSKLMFNLFNSANQRNLMLTHRLNCISSKDIRTRVIVYLSYEAANAKSSRITIPFDRQQMADYLNVERTALSKELGRMQKDGLLTFKKNTFTLLKSYPKEENGDLR